MARSERRAHKWIPVFLDQLGEALRKAKSIGHYIGYFYNVERRHSRVDDVSPIEFE